MADAGRIVIIPKGEYKSNITYERLDAVEYNNNGYIALKTVTGITPTNDGTNWALYVKGTQVDSELSTTSMNPVQNKVITQALQEKANTDNVDALNRTVTELQENKADKTEVREDISSINRNLTSEIIRAKEADETLKSRIDTITSLPEGSTTGDAELQDIRVKADGTTATSAGNAVREQFSELKGDLDDLRIESKNMFFVEQGEIVNGIITVNAEKTGSVINFKQNGQNTSNVYAVIKRLELEVGKTYTFSATRKSGYYNDSGAISLGIYRTDNNALVGSFSFWEILNGISNSFTFTADYSFHYIQLVFTSTGTIKEYDCDINFNLVEGAIADYSEYGYANINKELPTIKYLLKHNIYDIVVAKDGSGDYTTVTEAVANCDDFSTIYVKNGVYDNEIVKVWLKTLFIIGESREGVIIKNNTGAYDTPPIEMGTGMLKNLTVYAEGNATPNNKGYALHSESSVEASSCNFFILENCTFKSDYRQSWGMGMRGDTHYYARNCTFEEVYFHDCEHEYRATNQYIEFDSCNIIAKANGTALLLQDQQMSDANVNLMFNRCLVKSANGANIQYGKWTGSGIEWVSSLDDFPTWHLSTYSFGNSDNALNA